MNDAMHQLTVCASFHGLEQLAEDVIRCNSDSVHLKMFVCYDVHQNMARVIIVAVYFAGKSLDFVQINSFNYIVQSKLNKLSLNIK